MAVNLLVNGITYAYPTLTDEGWGPSASNWALAITQGTLQKAGGLFSLTSDVDFGPNAGLISVYYKSRSANIAQSGQIRLANTDTITFRNAENTGDLTFGPGSSDSTPAWNGVDIVGGSAGVSSLNTLTGAVTLSAGANITLTPTSNNIAIASTGGGTTITQEYVFNTGNVTNAGGSDLTSFGSGIGGTPLLAYNSTSTINSVIIFQCRFTNPFQPSDQLVLEILLAGSNSWISFDQAGAGWVVQNEAYYGAVLTPVTGAHSTTDIQVWFGNAGYSPGQPIGGSPPYNYGTNGATWSEYAGNWRVRKISFS